MRSMWMLFLLCTGLGCGPAHAAVGLDELAATAADGPVTLFYPTASPPQTLQRGQFTFELATQGTPLRGNGRLVVISHGSGGSPWVHANLARALVTAGFVVAVPQHRGDNYSDHSTPGPDSWKQRPAEVSRAIDAVGRDGRFGPLLDLGRVGVYGGSAGGHTVLSLAGGRWSPAGFKRHCEAHVGQDFQSCVGLITRLDGGFLDGFKTWLALSVIRQRFDDSQAQLHSDPRVAALVAAVPFAADFDMSSLATPRVPLGLITAHHDRWLPPRFHSDRVLAACSPRCEHLADLVQAGHGAMLSPLPAGLTGLLGDLLNDPPGFDRSELAAVDRKTALFFSRHLLVAAPLPTLARSSP